MIGEESRVGRQPEPLSMIESQAALREKDRRTTGNKRVAEKPGLLALNSSQGTSSQYEGGSGPHTNA